MGCDGETRFQVNFLESIQALMKHAAVALKDFKPTKQDREEAWAKENAPILLAQLETLVPELPLYRDLLPIVAEYAITWVVV